MSTKRIIVLATIGILIGLALGQCEAYAADQIVTLAWDANTEEDLAGYRIYASRVSGQYNYDPVIDIPAGTETAVIQVPDDVFYFVATAYDTAGNESEYSNEVMTPGIAPSPPGGFRTIKIEIKVEISE